MKTREGSLTCAKCRDPTHTQHLGPIGVGGSAARDCGVPRRLGREDLAQGGGLAGQRLSKVTRCAGSPPPLPAACPSLPRPEHSPRRALESRHPSFKDHFQWRREAEAWEVKKMRFIASPRRRERDCLAVTTAPASPGQDAQAAKRRGSRAHSAGAGGGRRPFMGTVTAIVRRRPAPAPAGLCGQHEVFRHSASVRRKMPLLCSLSSLTAAPLSGEHRQDYSRENEASTGPATARAAFRLRIVSPWQTPTQTLNFLASLHVLQGTAGGLFHARASLFTALSPPAPSAGLEPWDRLQALPHSASSHRETTPPVCARLRHCQAHISLFPSYN